MRCARARRRARRRAAGEQGGGGARTPRELARSATRWRGCPTSSARSGSCGRGAIGALHGSVGRCAEMARAVVDDARRAAAAAARRRATIAPGVDASSTSSRAARRRQGRDRAIQARSARARDRVAQGRLQQVFGYFIEITNANRTSCRRLSAAPDAHGAERYVTPALKEYEEKVLTRRSASRRASASCSRRCAHVGAEIGALQCAARIVAELDVLAALADVAAREGYVRPTLTDDFDLEITAGRIPWSSDDAARQVHPERRRARRRCALIILTGPNMAGKSTILRRSG
jgi:DNA mismatch repair protein MutS